MADSFSGERATVPKRTRARRVFPLRGQGQPSPSETRAFQPSWAAALAGCRTVGKSICAGHGAKTGGRDAEGLLHLPAIPSRWFGAGADVEALAGSTGRR